MVHRPNLRDARAQHPRPICDQLSPIAQDVPPSDDGRFERRSRASSWQFVVAAAAAVLPSGDGAAALTSSVSAAVRNIWSCAIRAVVGDIAHRQQDAAALGQDTGCHDGCNVDRRGELPATVSPAAARAGGLALRADGRLYETAAVHQRAPGLSLGSVLMEQRPRLATA